MNRIDLNQNSLTSRLGERVKSLRRELSTKTKLTFRFRKDARVEHESIP